jgi:hypothetical protein
MIDGYANSICISPPLDQQSKRLSADAEVKLDGLLRKVASIGVGTKYSDDQSRGVLQADLAKAIKDGNDCRKSVSDKLVDKLIPNSSPASPPKAATPDSANAPVALRDPSNVARRLRAFLAAKQLAIPGLPYSDAALISQYGVSPQSNGSSMSYPVLIGNYRVLTSETGSPIAHFSRIFAEQNGSLAGVLIVATCAGNATVMCADNYAEWKSSIESIMGNLQESKQTLGGGPGGGPFADQNGSTLKRLIAYDDPWRVYIDRMDPASGGPTAITLIVASLPQQ